MWPETGRREIWLSIVRNGVDGGRSQFRLAPVKAQLESLDRGGPTPQGPRFRRPKMAALNRRSQRADVFLARAAGLPHAGRGPWRRLGWPDGEDPQQDQG